MGCLLTFLQSDSAVTSLRTADAGVYTLHLRTRCSPDFISMSFATLPFVGRSPVGFWGLRFCSCAFCEQKKSTVFWPEKRNPGFCLFDFNGGISALPMTPYNSNLAVKTALLRVGAGERRAGRCWDTSLDPHPSPLPPSIPPLLQTFPH